MADEHRKKLRDTNFSKAVFVAFTDGVGRIANIAPDHFTVFSDESDWAFLGGDFKAAIDTMIASEERLQPPLPFEDDELVETE